MGSGVQSARGRVRGFAHGIAPAMDVSGQRPNPDCGEGTATVPQALPDVGQRSSRERQAEGYSLASALARITAERRASESKYCTKRCGSAAL